MSVRDSGIETADASTSTADDDNSENDISESSSRYTLTVSNGNRGHLARIRCVAFFPTSPETIYAVLTNPDNTGVFRDVLDSTRKVSNEGEGEFHRVVEVEQTGRVRLPFGEVKFKTRLRVTEDARDSPRRWTTRFELLSSDVLSTFDGTWTLEPRDEEEDDGKGKKKKSTTTVATLEQDVTPRGVPRWLKFVPLVGDGVKRACARAVRRMIEDLAAVADAVASKEGGDGSGGGWAVREVLRECHERAAREKEMGGKKKEEAVAADSAPGAASVS